MGLTLRPYQQDMSERIDEAWHDGAKNVCAVMPCGGGKTILFGTKLASTQGIRFAVAHRQELVTQMSLTIAKMGVEHCVIAQDSLLKYIIKSHIKNYGKNFHNPRATCIVVGVQTLINRAHRLPVDRAALWVIDECFPAGTLVDGKPIEQYNIGDLVWSFNEGTGVFEKQQIVRLFKKPMPNKMITVNNQITCTLNHPFYTQRGWVEAGKLTTNDLLLHRMRERNPETKRIPEILFQQKRKNILSPNLWLQIPNKTLKKTKTRRTKSYLSRVWHQLYGYRLETLFVEKRKKCILLRKMFKILHVENFIRNYDSNESKVCVGQDAQNQSYAQKRIKRKNGKNTSKHWSFSKTTRRERSSTDASRKNINKYVWGNGFRAGMCRKDRSLQRRFRVPNMLQNRLWESCLENRNRGGWWQSFFNRKTKSRLEKRQIFKWERVENIQIHEPRNYERPIKNYVYNIEVYGNHTYIANNYVVHNCHHCLRSNIFGKVAKLFPSTAHGLGVTATPNRADGRGIGKHADGIFDVMVEGPNMRWFIRNGYLTDYRIFGPYSNVDMSSVTVTSSGDYSRKKLTTAVRESKIVGDVVKSYLEFAPGKTGVVFVPDVQTGEDMAAAYINAGVPAKCVHAKTPDIERHDAIQALKNGALKLLVNVDIFGEGFDLPAIELVIMARPTESLPLYIQQFGRGLRTMEGKDKAIIIDHVHNIERHRLPDSPREWNLDSRERKASKRDPNLVPIRTCRNCLAIYESWIKDCPYCDWVYEPMSMGSVEQVEGVITELDPAVLASMRGEIDRIDGPAPTVPGAPQAGINAQWRKRQEAQHALRDAMACWAGYQRAAWQTDDVIMRKFYAQYGIDVLSAQALGRKDAEELTIKLMEAVK